jgi:hypothetical protein
VDDLNVSESESGGDQRLFAVMSRIFELSGIRDMLKVKGWEFELGSWSTRSVCDLRIDRALKQHIIWFGFIMRTM